MIKIIKTEWLRRAVRTFMQAVIGFIAANLVSYAAGVDFNDKAAIRAALVTLGGSALAAGVAALMNLNKEES